MSLIYRATSNKPPRGSTGPINPGNSDYLAALAGNPNTGKSTVFNALTGLKQHTGNWPGKTVIHAQGSYRHQGKTITLVDLPGTYSLLSNSPEEEVARNFICFGEPDVTIVVADATCLERNLNLALQVMEITPRTVICLNLIDEARRKNIHIDHQKLQKKLGVPVIPTAARSGLGLDRLKETVSQVVTGRLRPNPRQIRYEENIEKAVAELATRLAPALKNRISKRWIALRLMEGDYSVITGIKEYLEDRSQ